MNIKANEIAAILKEEIKSYKADFTPDEVGIVVEVGDGIARVMGLPLPVLRVRPTRKQSVPAGPCLLRCRRMLQSLW